MLPISARDITLLDVLGYDLSNPQSGTAAPAGNGPVGIQSGAQLTDVPEPGTLGLLGTALLGLGAARFGRRRA